MESPGAIPSGQQATVFPTLVPQPHGSDTQGEPSPEPWFPLLPLSFLVQKVTKCPAVGCAAKTRPTETLPAGPGQGR